MEIWQLAVYGGALLVLSVLSGIAGSGAGFIMTPLAIIFGLTPAQAVASGKLNGLAVATGSLSGIGKASRQISKRRVVPVMVLAFFVGLTAPLLIKSLENDFYRIALGVILLLMIPVVIYKQVGHKAYHPARWQKYAGSGLLTLALFLQGVFSGGLGTLVNVVLMGMLGMDALEANITKRWSSLILNTTIVLSLVGSGLILWPVAIVGSSCGLVGSFLGGRMAANKGNKFIMRILIGFMAVSALALIFGVE